MAPRLEVVHGDITDQRVDAIVNAANSSLLGGGGVDGAIHRAGGLAILEACRELRPTGHAVATTAGELPARWVVHTVGPVYGRNGDRDAELLAACHTSSLAEADRVGAATVAVPAISTGAFGYPIGEAAPIAITTVLDTPTHAELVRFVLFGDDAFDAFGAAIP
jgi:O-acetyl-ADP-ribose deacetylase